MIHDPLEGYDEGLPRSWRAEVLKYVQIRMSEFEDGYISMPVDTTCIQTLASVLGSAQTLDEIGFAREWDHQLEVHGFKAPVGDEASLLDLQRSAELGQMFLKVLSPRVHLGLRNKVAGKRKLTQFDFGVSLHKALDYEVADKSVVVDTQPVMIDTMHDQNLQMQAIMMSPYMLSNRALNNLSAWTVTDELIPFLHDCFPP